MIFDVSFKKNDDFLATVRSFLFIAIGFSIPLSVAAVSIFFVLLFAVWLLDGNYYCKIESVRSNPVFVAITVFFILHLLGLYWLDAPMPVDGFKSWMVFLIPVLATAVDTKTARRGVYAFIVAMMISESWVYLNILSNWKAYINLEPLSPIISGRFFISGDRISYNPMLAFAIALLLTTILTGYYKSWRLAVAIGFLVTMVVNMFMTEGRAGHVAFIFVWVVLSVYFFRKRHLALAGMIGAVILIVALAFNYSPVFKHRIMQAQNDLIHYEDNILKAQNLNQPSAIGHRLHFTDRTLRQFLNEPWLGYGTGSFVHAYNKQVEKYPGKVLPTTNPHNYHALILLQFGLVGFLIYSAIYATQLRLVRVMPVAYEYRALAVLLPLFYILINFYDTYLWGHHLQAMFAYMTAIFYRRDMWEIVR